MNVRRLLLSSVAALGVLTAAGQAAAQSRDMPMTAPVDERSSLTPGLHDAGQAIRGLELLHALEPAPGFYDPARVFSPPRNEAEGRAMAEQARGNPGFSPLGLANTDMAVSNGRLFVGNFNGINIYNLSADRAPQLAMSIVCPGGQGDVSVHGNLLFMSVEENRGRLDCGTNASAEQISAERFRGVRIFDITDLNAPRQIAAVQTCRGSHTHTLVPSPNDPNTLFIYNSATSGVRKTGELDICSDGQPDANAETALYSIDVIKVPLDRPQDAAIVNRPRIFADRETGRINGLWTGGRAGAASQNTSVTNHCHDITVYPELGIAGGACSGNGILLDITDPQNPTRISELFDPDMAYWHSATFNNEGNHVVFTDEWGGGTSARCRATDPYTWGANLIATIDNRQLKGQRFFKLPSVQGDNQNCVAHNGNIIPVPGRDLMVQAWYQGGVSIMDFTDPSNPTEIAYFDRGPLNEERVQVGGSWSAYWFNGRIYSSEIVRGLDVLKLIPSDQLSAAEIAAAEAIQSNEINPQTQTRITWADTPDVAQSYLDQLARTNGLEADVATRAGAVVTGWRGGRVDKRAAGRLAQALRSASEKAQPEQRGRITALADLFGRISA